MESGRTPARSESHGASLWITAASARCVHIAREAMSDAKVFCGGVAAKPMRYPRVPLGGISWPVGPCDKSQPAAASAAAAAREPHTIRTGGSARMAWGLRRLPAADKGFDLLQS